MRQYPVGLDRKHIVWQGQYGGMLLSICRLGLGQIISSETLDSAFLNNEWHCGYITLHGKKDDQVESDIPFHGGCTYCHEEDGYVTYGFDTNHAFDKDNPGLQDLSWLQTHLRVIVDWYIHEMISRGTPFHPKNVKDLEEERVVDRFEDLLI